MIPSLTSNNWEGWLNKTTLDNSEVKKESRLLRRDARDDLYNPNWKDGIADDEVRYTCCEKAQGTRCCNADSKGECCKLESTRCGAAHLTRKKKLFCACTGYEDCVARGMWEASRPTLCHCSGTMRSCFDGEMKSSILEKRI